MLTDELYAWRAYLRNESAAIGIRRQLYTVRHCASFLKLMEARRPARRRSRFIDEPVFSQARELAVCSGTNARRFVVLVSSRIYFDLQSTVDVSPRNWPGWLSNGERGPKTIFPLVRQRAERRYLRLNRPLDPLSLGSRSGWQQYSCHERQQHAAILPNRGFPLGREGHWSILCNWTRACARPRGGSRATVKRVHIKTR